MKSSASEAGFEQTVIELAQLCGWKVAHFRRSRTATGWVTAVGADGKGWPDLFLAHPTRGLAIAWELKVPPNKTTPEQEEWIDVLRAVGIDAKTVTPDDWEYIERVLKP